MAHGDFSSRCRWCHPRGAEIQVSFAASPARMILDGEARPGKKPPRRRFLVTGGIAMTSNYHGLIQCSVRS